MKYIYIGTAPKIVKTVEGIHSVKGGEIIETKSVITHPQFARYETRKSGGKNHVNKTTG